MTVEEIEILVTAKVEEALKDFGKIVPTIRKTVKQAQEAFSQVDASQMKKGINQAVQFVKNKIQDLKKNNKSNEISIKVNNKEAKKQISQIQKQIDSLNEKINSRKLKLNVTSNRLDEITAQTTSEYTPKGVNPGNPAIQKVVNESLGNNKEYNTLLAQESKLTEQIKAYKIQLEQAKSKMSGLKQEVEKTTSTQNRLSAFFNAFKNKIGQARSSVSGIKSEFNGLPRITQKVTNNIKNMGGGLKQGLGHILKYATALFSLRGIYSVLSQSAQAWLGSQNAEAQQLSANIEYMKYAMGNALAPVIQMITNLVYQLMKAIQSLVYAFSGVNIFAKATASSMKSASGSAKEASKSLSGVHGEINNVSENKSSGGGGSTAPSMDLSQIDMSTSTWVNELKIKLKGIFHPIQGSWAKYGQPLIKSIKNAFNNTIGLIQAIGKSFNEVWTNGTGEQTINIILQLLTSVFGTISNINEAFKSAWENNGGTEIIQNIWNGLNNIISIALGLKQTFEEWTASEGFQEFANSIIGISATLSGWFDLVTKKLREIWENGGKKTFTSLLEFISKLTTAINSIITFLTPVIEFVLNIVTPVINGIIEVIGHVINALSGVLDFIIGIFTGDWERAWNGIKDFFTGIWNAIKTVVETVCNTISNIWKAVSTTIANVWNSIVSKIKDGVRGAWNAITSVFGNIAGWFKDKFTQAWTAVKNVFSTGGKIFDGIKDGIVNVFKTIVNGIIGGINKVIAIPFNSLNNVLNRIRNINIAGVEPFTWIYTFNVPQIPKLATGNVAYKPMIAEFGEYAGASNNPEITTPQNIMRETFEEVLANNNSDKNERPIRVQIYWGTKNVVDEIIDGINEKTRQTGRAQIKVSYT